MRTEHAQDTLLSRTASAANNAALLYFEPLTRILFRLRQTRYSPDRANDEFLRRLSAVRSDVLREIDELEREWIDMIDELREESFEVLQEHVLDWDALLANIHNRFPNDKRATDIDRH
jgi:hypothetical protein